MKSLILGALAGAAAWAIYRTAYPPRVLVTGGTPHYQPGTSGWSPQQIGQPGDYTLEGAAVGALAVYMLR